MSTSRGKLRSLVIWLGACVAAVVAVAVPAGYFWVGYSALHHDLSFSAHLKANRLAKYIYTHEELWQYQSHRLSQLIEVPEADESAMRQRIFDVEGRLVLESGSAPPFPRVVFSTPLVVAGSAVGMIETAASLRSVVTGTAVVALLSGLLGFSVFFALRLLPLRVIDRTLGELESMQERYRRLFQANPFPTVVVDRGTMKFLDANEATVTRYGWSWDELLSMTSNDLYPPDDLPTAAADWERFLRSSDDVALAVRHRKKDGTVIDVEQTVHPIEFAGRDAFLVTTHDVTERNRAMKELSDSRERYHALIEALPVGVLETTADNRIVTANRAWRRMFGFGDTEDLSVVDVQALYADRQDRKAVIETVAGERVPSIEALFRRRDGTTFPVERFVRSVTNAEGQIIGLRGIVIDITQRKSLEAQLSQSQKMEAIGQLTGGVAHDLNNIMMIILANTDALREDVDLGGYGEQCVARIAKACQRATDLTRSLLAFSHKLPLRPQRTDLNELIVRTGKLLRRTLGAEIEIRSTLAGDLWPVEIDRGQFENALVNLCLNARDAMPNGGELTIETANMPELPGASPGGYAMVSVSDTGTGIHPDILPKVFEPFFTTKSAGKGTGLGLSMVHGFIKQSKGQIEIESEIGRGTTIRISLPRSSEPAVRETEPPTPEPPRGHEQILVVEDESTVRETVAAQLQTLGYSVTAVANAGDALADLEAAAKPYDLLLTDVVMPGLSGKALAGEVARRWPGISVLFMSGYSHDAIVRDGRLEPDAKLLTKPFRKLDLAQAVRQMLDDSTRPAAPSSAPLLQE